MKKIKENGITLIALVVTIVLIILATVAIQLSLGDNGIFNKAKEATEQYKNVTQYEETEIAKYSNEIEIYTRAGNSSSYKEIILYDGDASSGDISFKDKNNNIHKADEFDGIKFLYGLHRNGGWDCLQVSEYSINDWNFAIDNVSTTNNGIALYGWDGCAINLKNISNTGFSIASVGG